MRRLQVAPLLVLLLLVLAVAAGRADTVHYVLQDVVLEEGNAVLTGTFAWSFTPGDFENGTGEFLALDVPFSVHDQTDLQAIFDMGGSIEITLPGNFHDDGVDIVLFLTQPLTPTTGASVDLARSHYDIGGGVHMGGFVGGSVEPFLPTGTGDGPVDGRVISRLETHPNPFNPATVLEWDLSRPSRVSLAVYDLAGRRVRLLLAGREQAAGRHSRRWRGRDDTGRSVPAGVYLARLSVDDRSQVVRLVLAR